MNNGTKAAKLIKAKDHSARKVAKRQADKDKAKAEAAAKQAAQV